MIRFAVSFQQIKKTVTVEPFVFLCMKAFYLQLVSLPQIILDNVCLKKHNATKCHAMFNGMYKPDFDVVQQESTLWLGGYLVVTTLIIVMFLPAIGAISDKLGRYRAMLLSPIGQFVQTLAFLGILANGLNFPTWLLLLAGPITAVVGDVSGLFVLAGSYISELTTVEQRTMRLTILEASQLIGGLSASVCSGLIIEKFGYKAIFIANLILLSIALAYLVVYVKPVDSVKQRNESNGFVVEGSKDRIDAFLMDEIKAHGTECSLLKDHNVMMENNSRNSTAHNEAENQKTDKLEEYCHMAKQTGFCQGAKLEIKARIGNNDRENMMTENETILHEAIACDEFEDASAKTKDDKCDRNDLCFDKTEEYSREQVEMGLCNRAVMARKSCENRDEIIQSDTERMEAINSNTTSRGDVTCKQNTEEEKGSDKLGAILQDQTPEITVIKQRGYGEKRPACAGMLIIIKEANVIHNLKNVRTILKANGQLLHGSLLFLLMSLAAVSYSGDLAVTALYLKNRPYFLPPTDLGYFFAYQSGMLAILGMVVFNFVLTKVIKIEDNTLLVFNTVMFILYFVLLAFSKTLLMLYLIQLIHAAGTLNTCAIRSMLTKIVPKSSIGTVFGALSMVEAFFVIVGVLLCPLIYSNIAAINPGAVFFVNAGLMLISTPVAVYLLTTKKKREQIDSEENT